MFRSRHTWASRTKSKQFIDIDKLYLSVKLKVKEFIQAKAKSVSISKSLKCTLENKN